MAGTEQPLGERKERILHAIVEAYIKTAEPVGSKTVADETELGVSSATVRNEMVILEREGYITHPHTSAGRLPTDKGYRYYVDVLAPQRNMDRRHVQEIEHSLAGTLTALDDLLQKASELLAELTEYTALAAAPPITEAKLRFVDLIPLGGSRAFLILVAEGARHEEGILDLGSEVPEDVIRRTAERINQVVSGLGPTEAADRVIEVADGDHAEIMRRVGDAIRTLSRITGRLYTGGASHIVAWGEPLTTRRVLEAIEAGTVGPLLSRPHTGDVNVQIGSEMPLEELHELSLILSGYRLGQHPAGTLGVLGPTRMDYPRVIAVVSTVARAVSRALRRIESA